MSYIILAHPIFCQVESSKPLSISQVFRCSFWMGLLGSKTPKRTLIWSNDPFIRALDLGKMAKGSKQKSTSRSLTALCIDWHKIKKCYRNAIQTRLVIQTIFFGVSNLTTIIVFLFVLKPGSQGTYRDAAGRKRFQGKSKEMRESQPLYSA